MIEAKKKGQLVDLTNLPGLPLQSSLQSQSSQANNQPQEEIVIPEMNQEEASKIFNAPPPPLTIVEALQQRIEKFKSTLQQAQEENNSSRARRLNRIIKQCENALKDYKNGKDVNFDELPTPPGLFNTIVII